MTLLIIAIIVVILIAIVAYFLLKKKGPHASIYSYSSSLDLPTNSYPLKLTRTTLSCDASLNVQKLTAELKLETRVYSRNVHVNLDMNSNNLLVLGQKELKEAPDFELADLGGQINIKKNFGYSLGGKKIGIGMIQSGTTRTWCENILGLLEPNVNNPSGLAQSASSGLELVNWNRMKNFSLDLRNENDMRLTIDDSEEPELKLPRFYQSKDSKNRMINAEYYTIKVDSMQLENGKESGPFYYIIDVGSNVDIIPKNLALWLNYENEKVSYVIGNKTMIQTNMSNIIYRKNYLIDRDGTILHAGLIGLNSMLGLKWFFSDSFIGISK